MGPVVGVIHARGGSKRIPGKNVKLLGGKPLLAWMVQAARASRLMDRVIVSTDDDEIASVARDYGAEVPFRRPAHLAEDVASELVTLHALDFLEGEGYHPEVAVTMQPTTPFCTGGDIDAVIEKIAATGADSVISVREVRERPEWMFRLNGDAIESLMNLVLSGEMNVWQSLPKLYTPNGGIYATRCSALREQGVIICRDTRAVVMPHERSIDVDEPIDFLVAEAVVAQHAEFAS